MIVMFSDFGHNGPYIGQVQAAIQRKLPESIFINLMADAPAFNIQASAYLLASLVTDLPDGTIVLGVVDPGVGTDRRAALVKAENLWFVGPDNGLFNVVAQRARKVQWWDIVWRPARLSKSFHGRDLFAPVAASLELGRMPPAEEQNPNSRIDATWPPELAQVIYVDHYGNAMTGIRAESVSERAELHLNGQSLTRAHTFGEVPRGHAFWYANSSGLVEIAVNQDRADRVLNIKIGDVVEVRQ